MLSALTKEDTSMEIVVHFRKKRFLFDAGLIAFAALLFGAISYLLTYVKIYPAPLLFSILLLGTYSWLWRMFRVLFFHQPALIINGVGIRLFPVYISGSFFISWSEIQKISVEKYNFESCICIYPKEEEKYLTHLQPFKRFVIRLWRSKGEAVMNTSLFYLDKPVVEIFQQISHAYANELHEHDIQLRP